MIDLTTAPQYDTIQPLGTGKMVRGKVAQKMLHGYGCTNKCSPPIIRSYNDTSSERAYPKGQSCSHIVGSIITTLKRLGWDREEVLELCVSDTFPGLAWIKYQDNCDDLFARWWEGSYSPAETRNNVVTTRSKQTTTFQFRYAVWCQLLDIIEAEPGCSVKRVKELMPYLEGHSKLYLAEGKERGYIEDRGPKRKNGSALRSELYVVARPAQPRITRPRWNQPKAQREFWEKVHSIPKLHAQDDETLVEWYESGALDRLIEAWDREHNASTAVKAPVSHSQPLKTASGTRAHLDDSQPLESDTANATEEEILDIIRVMSLC